MVRVVVTSFCSAIAYEASNCIFYISITIIATAKDFSPKPKMFLCFSYEMLVGGVNGKIYMAVKFSLRIFHFSAYRDISRTLQFGGCNVDFTWICVINNYVFQCLKAKFFGYLQETRAGWKARLSKTFNVLRILEYPIPTI